MKITLATIVAAAALVASTNARADGPESYPPPGTGAYGGYGGYAPGPGPGPGGYENPDPSAAVPPGNDQVYQPPPEGVCVDDNQQQYDCSNDEDYNQYNQIDDGYDPAAYQDFREALEPYGQWVDSAQYGQVWVPSATTVGAEFSPYYTGGHWVLSDYGWTWVSDYAWGWAPFHYGRWLSLPGYGWTWIPGRVWGPSWVHWRTGGGYVGWAALPPRGVRIAPPLLSVRVHSWNFVAAEHLTAPRLMRVAPAMMPHLYMRTAIANDYRSIGSTRIIVGPQPHQLPMLHIQPTPLRTLSPAMPRAQITVRPGVPLQQRPYYAPGLRGAPGPARPGYLPPSYQRPPYGGGYGRPGYPAPGYTHPGYPAPAPAPGYTHPGYPAPAPGYGHPGYPTPAPGYTHPGYPAPAPAPGYGHPGYPAPAPAPGYGHPGYPAPAPGYSHPGYPAPAPAPVPGYGHPGYPAPAPGYPAAPSSPPAPSYSHPSYPAPAPQPAPSAPSYHPAPAPAPHPSIGSSSSGHHY
jgi:hypothetical protein